MVFDIPGKTATVPAKAGRSLDERLLLQSFKQVKYRTPLTWLELTVVGAPAQWNGHPAFKVGKSERIFRLGRLDEGQKASSALDQYLEAVQSGRKVRQVVGRVAGWKLLPKGGWADPVYEEEPDQAKGESSPPFLLMVGFETDDELNSCRQLPIFLQETAKSTNKNPHLSWLRKI